MTSVLAVCDNDDWQCNRVLCHVCEHWIYRTPIEFEQGTTQNEHVASICCSPTTGSSELSRDIIPFMLCSPKVNRV